MALYIHTDNAQGNGVIRIGDILRFEPVSIRAATGVLSFQKGYLPIFEVFLSAQNIGCRD
jgi:hypothetical protein